MKWKQFFGPQISKIVLLVIVILIFGVPATSRDCQTYITTSTPPPCIEHFTFSNIILDLIGFDRYPYVLDAAIYYSYNPIFVALYVVALYLIISLIFHLSGYKWKKAYLYVAGIILIIFLVFILLSIMGVKTYRR